MRNTFIYIFNNYQFTIHFDTLSIITEFFGISNDHSTILNIGIMSHSKWTTLVWIDNLFDNARRVFKWIYMILLIIAEKVFPFTFCIN